MERMSISLFTNLARFTSSSLDSLTTQIRDYLESFLNENPVLQNTLRENCKVIEPMFGVASGLLLEMHLSYLASKYAFRVYFSRSPEDALAHSVAEISVDWTEFDEADDASNGKVILINHYGRYIETSAKLAMDLATRSLPTAIAVRRRIHPAVQEYHRSFQTLSDMYGGKGILTRYVEICDYLKQNANILLLFPDHADFSEPSRNQAYEFVGNTVVHLSRATDAIIKETGCQVYLANNLSEQRGPIRLSPLSRQSPTQDAILIGLVEDMEHDPSKWDRIKYFDRLMKPSEYTDLSPRHP